MKSVYKISKIVSLFLYIFLLYQLWHLCRYGSLRRHTFGIVICIACLAVSVILCLILRRLTLKQKSVDDDRKDKKVSITILCYGFCTLLFGILIIYSALPYHGALSWKIDERMRKKEVVLEHDNLFEDGIEGILNDLETALGLPEELYIANKFQVTFDETGAIQSIYAFLYGKNAKEKKKTYLIDYNADVNSSMTVWIDGNAEGQYEQEMLLSPMVEILNRSDWKDQVKDWSASTEGQQIYEILYCGRRSFHTADGLKYVPGDADGDGKETGIEDFAQLGYGGEIVGYEVSLHIPANTEIDPLRYIMEPEYVSQKQLDEERQDQQVEAALNEESWTVDQTDGTMYFFLDEETGWRLVVTDAAAGSRFYAMEKTENRGTDWERINKDPFKGEIGVTEGLVFFDEDFGFAGLTGASQSYSQLYVTKDGGKSFEKIQLPMDTVTELPELDYESEFTIEDYDYLNMPQKNDSVITIIVTTDAAEHDAVLFQSKDEGITWEYCGNVKK